MAIWYTHDVYCFYSTRCNIPGSCWWPTPFADFCRFANIPFLAYYTHLLYQQHDLSTNGGSNRQLIQKKPPTPTCRSNSECKKLKNSICVKGSCKCKIGFYRISGKGQCKACLDHPPASKKLECVQRTPAPTPLPTTPLPTLSQEELDCRSKGFKSVGLCIASTFLQLSAQDCEPDAALIYDVDLDNTPLTGTIPSEIGLLTKLYYLSLSNTTLKGTIPTELGKLSNELGKLSLDNNGLTGPIPTELGQLVNLRSLDLSSNRLSGPIPTVLGQLNQLRTLLLGENQLEGSIPTELGLLTKLQVLGGLYNNYPTGGVIDTFCRDPVAERFCY